MSGDPFDDELGAELRVDLRMIAGIAIVEHIADKFLGPYVPDDDWDLNDVPTDDLREAILAIIMCGGWDVERGAHHLYADAA